MKHEMRIELSAAEGATLRTLGLIERRGFLLHSCAVHPEEDERRVLDIAVVSERPVAVLMRQIDRLHDVLSVQLQAAAHQVAGKVGLSSAMGRQR